MKSIHAFSALLADHGPGVPANPEKNHPLRPITMSAKHRGGAGNRRISAISTLLAVALFQCPPSPRRPED
jgi:hypothetical protein